MKRASTLGVFFLFTLGCAIAEERQALVAPLPEDSVPQPYVKLLRRARAQALAVTDALYVDDWDEADAAAKGLEQTARFLNKATEVPAKQKDNLPVISGDLGKEAGTLRELVKGHDSKKADEVMQRINLKIRELKPEN